MKQILRVIVVIPAFEAGDMAIRVAREAIPWADGVVLVDDGSTEPLHIPPEMADRVRMIRHSRNLGVGAAILSGYAAARMAEADVAVVMAGDGQMAIEDLPGLVAPIADGVADYVKGDRLSHPDCPQVMPLTRFLGNCCLTFLTRLISGRWSLMDAQCGYTALRLSLLDRLPIQAIYPRYGFPNDLLAALRGINARVLDVTVQPRYRGERSGIRPELAVFVYPFILIRAWLLMACLTARRAFGRDSSIQGEGS